MKILFLAHLFPLPLDSGGKIKSFCTLKTLAQHHEVRLLAYVRNELESAMLSEVRRVCAETDVVSLRRSAVRSAWDAFAALALGKSFVVARDFRRDMIEAFKKVLAEFEPDVVHIDHLQMAQFVDFGDSRYKTVLDQHNVEYLIVKRMAETAESAVVRQYAQLEWPKLMRYELDVCRRSDLVITVSEQDKSTLHAMDSSLQNIYAVPIGIDVDAVPVVKRSSNTRNLLFLGAMHWPPNIDCVLWFYKEILPLIKAEIPDCIFTIAGQRAPKSVTSLASDPSVRVIGYVADQAAVAKDCSVFIVPLRSGSGVRVKILNAMAMGLPIVSTSIGAEGIEVEHGKHLLIADTPDEFAKSVVSVLQNASLADILGQNARQLVCERYSYEVVGKKLLSVYESALSAPNIRTQA